MARGREGERERGNGSLEEVFCVASNQNVIGNKAMSLEEQSTDAVNGRAGRTLR